MCGRFAVVSLSPQVAESFGAGGVIPSFKARYNLAPTQLAPVIPNRAARQVELFRWGLIPSWAKEPAIGNKLINARAETLAGKPSFCSAFRLRRCLVIADGFYEWKREGKRKQPHFIRLKSGKPFAFAGLWESWAPAAGEEVRSFTIVTTEASQLVRTIHDRMPVILPPEVYPAWLAPEPQEPEKLAGLLAPFEPALMELYPVSTLVSSPQNDVPDCLRPVPGA